VSEPYGILTMSQFEEIHKVVASKDAEIARLRLTAEEREAIAFGIACVTTDKHAATLRSLLERTN